MAELTDAQKVLRNDTGKRIAAAIEAPGGTPQIDLGMTGASVGQVPVINTVDANGAPTSYRPGSGGGGGGGTSDYDDLTDKPSINGTTLSGNKTAADLGLGTYTKPSGGIPQTDLASAVQAALVPAGGSAGQIPVKASATNYDLKWATVALHISVASFSSFPQTISNSAITAGMRVVNCVWGTPSAITGDVTWTTADGSLTLSGSISGSTTAEIDLILF